MNGGLPSRLYAIVDAADEDGRDVVRRSEGLLRGGARLLQLRWKRAGAAAFLDAAIECRRFAARYDARLLINDRLDVALACDADGVHLGQTDLPLAVARRLLGADRWIGISTHDVAQARLAAAGGADYIGFGPMFATPTKRTGYSPRGLSALREVRAAVSLPIVAIGGIDFEHAAEVIAAGADAVAMISALAAGPDAAAAARTALERLGGGRSP
jgi:thiamine-phosphate pyrophosphorylase